MIKQPRVGDIGTQIVLDIVKCLQLIDLKGIVKATIEITHNLGTDVYPAEHTQTSLIYSGKSTDNLWPVSGLYRIRGIVEWLDGRKFTTSDIMLTVE